MGLEFEGWDGSPWMRMHGEDVADINSWQLKSPFQDRRPESGKPFHIMGIDSTSALNWADEGGTWPQLRFSREERSNGKGPRPEDFKLARPDLPCLILLLDSGTGGRRSRLPLEEAQRRGGGTAANVYARIPHATRALLEIIESHGTGIPDRW